MVVFRKLLIAFLLSACGSTAAPPEAPPAPRRSAQAPSAPLPSPSSPREDSALAAELSAEGVAGTIALLDTADGVARCSDVSVCRAAAIPASTFKIPNSMIALETGIVEGPDTILPWDGQLYPVDAWNQDMSLRNALLVSCVPCYQAIARQVGEQRMREWVEKLDYGNRDIAGGIDRFWLTGALRITPLEQVEFLRRFDENKLPISDHAADVVRDIMTLDVTENYVLRGKTGLFAAPDEPVKTGWFVGWLELGARRVYFATLLTGHDPGVELAPARRRVTERVLRAQGYL